MKPRALPSDGEVFAFPLRRGWGYCQVLSRDRKSCDVVGLDQWSEQPLALDAVSMRVLRQHNHFWPDRPHRLIVAGSAPASFVSLGVAPPATDEPPLGSYAMWESMPVQFEMQLRWNALPNDARAAFYASRSSEVKVHFGRVTLAASQRCLKIAFGPRADADALHFDSRSPIDFSVFDVVTGLLYVDVTGNPPGLVEWLATRPMIESLTWRGAPPAVIDLRATGLTACALYGHGSHDVWLPADLETLTIHPAENSHWRVHAHEDGALLDLHVRTWRGESLAQIEGIPRARSLSVSNFDALDLREITARYSPRSLTLSGAPGALRSSDALAALTSLESLECWHCLQVDAAHMPPLDAWPRLEKLWVVEALDTESAALKARWGRDRRVSVRSPRTAEWARHFAGHPLRNWRDPHKCNLASGAYSTASRRLAAATDARAVQKVMKAMIKALNRTHAQTQGFTLDEVRDLETVWALLIARAPVAVDAKDAGAWLATGRKDW